MQVDELRAGDRRERRSGLVVGLALEPLNVRDGQWVKEGDVLANLINHEKEKDRTL